MQDFPLPLSLHHPDWVIELRSPRCPVRLAFPQRGVEYHTGHEMATDQVRESRSAADMCVRQAEGQPLASSPHRAVSSGGEHFLDAEGVRGSNPLPPTL
jgi:hypothetical protein